MIKIKKAIIELFKVSIVIRQKNEVSKTIKYLNGLLLVIIRNYCSNVCEILLEGRKFIMIDIKISEEIKEACPNAVLGVVQAKVSVNESSETLLKEIDDYASVLQNELKLEELTLNKAIKDGREAYKSLGKSPSKYRLSSEALVRRILQGKGIYRVNNIVDINNLISIKSKFPVGSYDVSNINGTVSLNRADDGATYKGIGKTYLNIEHLPVLVDNDGPFGSPTSDSERAMIGESSKEIVMCIYSFSGDADLEEYLSSAKELLEKYADGSDFETRIIA